MPTRPKLEASWNVCPPELEPINATSQFFGLFFSPCFYNPINAISMAHNVLALLDACVFLGSDTPAVREKLGRAFALLRKQAEIWPLARRLEITLKDVAASCLPPAATSGTGALGGLNIIGDHLWPDSLFPERGLVPGHQAQDPLAASMYAPIQEGVPSECFEEWLMGGE